MCANRCFHAWVSCALFLFLWMRDSLQLNCVKKASVFQWLKLSVLTLSSCSCQVCVCVVLVHTFGLLFFELYKGVTCLCVQQQLVTRAYYIIGRIINQFLLVLLILFWSLGTNFVTSYHTNFCSHVCMLCLCLNITKLVLSSARKLHLAKQALMGNPHKVTSRLPICCPCSSLSHMRRLQDACPNKRNQIASFSQVLGTWTFKD